MSPYYWQSAAGGTPSPACGPPSAEAAACLPYDSGRQGGGRKPFALRPACANASARRGWRIIRGLLCMRPAFGIERGAPCGAAILQARDRRHAPENAQACHAERSEASLQFVPGPAPLGPTEPVAAPRVGAPRFWHRPLAAICSRSGSLGPQASPARPYAACQWNSLSNL